MTQDGFEDEPPESAQPTEYDRTHSKLYLRLLDADAEGADWRDVVSVLFDLDPSEDPIRARFVYDRHLARARWMTDQGYRHLLHEHRH